MFEGIFTTSTDCSGRITLPLKLRKGFVSTLIDEKMIITKARPVECNHEFHQGCSIYLYREWERFEKRIESSDFDETTKNAIQRLFLSPASERVMDWKGRILIPVWLRCHSKVDIKQKVVLVGMIDHINIWSMDSWVKIERLVKDRRSEISE